MVAGPRPHRPETSGHDEVEVVGRARSRGSPRLPALDSTKTVCVISLPGAITGLILAAVDPFTAIRYPIVVMYMLLAAALAALTAVRLAERALFDDAHRFRPLAAQPADR
ncbi:ABC transporter permease [Streptomyces sp. NPDC001492]